MCDSAIAPLKRGVNKRGSVLECAVNRTSRFIFLVCIGLYWLVLLCLGKLAVQVNWAEAISDAFPRKHWDPRTQRWRMESNSSASCSGTGAGTVFFDGRKRSRQC